MCCTEFCAALHVSEDLLGGQFLISFLRLFFCVQRESCLQPPCTLGFSPSFLNKLQLMQRLLSDLSPSIQQENSLVWMVFSFLFSRNRLVPHADLSPAQAFFLNEQMNQCFQALLLEMKKLRCSIPYHWDALVSSSFPFAVIFTLLNFSLLRVYLSFGFMA